GVVGKVLFEQTLVELGVVERSEGRCEAAQRPNKPPLRGHDVNDEAELNLAREIETARRLALHISKRPTLGQRVMNNLGAAVRRIGDIAGSVGCLEGALHQVT